MPDPLTIITGITLLKKSIDGIKGAIGTARDIGDIASDLDGFFNAKEEIDKKAKKNDNLGLKGQLGIDTVAQEIIDRKIAHREEMELSNLLNLSFGPGTYNEIKQERLRRKKEAKAKALRIKQQAEKKRKELIQGISIITAIVFGGAFILFSIYILVKFLV